MSLGTAVAEQALADVLGEESAFADLLTIEPIRDAAEEGSLNQRPVQRSVEARGQVVCVSRL